MNEYERNREQIAEYRRRTLNRFLLWICKVMELVNEKFIRDDEQEEK